MCLAYQSGSGTRFKYEHNSEVILIDKDANIIDTNDLFTWGNDFEPSLKGSCIFDDTVIAGSDALYIARQNGDKYEVYRFAAEK